MRNRQRLAFLLAVVLCSIAHSSCEVGDPPQVLTGQLQDRSLTCCSNSMHAVVVYSIEYIGQLLCACSACLLRQHTGCIVFSWCFVVTPARLAPKHIWCICTKIQLSNVGPLM